MDSAAHQDQDSFGYGEFSLGPLTGPALDRLDDALSCCGLSLPLAFCEDPVSIAETIGGFLLEVKGEGVLSYLVSVEDGLEAERSQLLALGHALLRPGGELRIEGLHKVGDRMAVRVETTIRRAPSDPAHVDVVKRQHCRRLSPETPI